MKTEIELTQHPLGALFPPMEAQEFENLVEDVRAHGIIKPIVLLDNMVLDGWQRYRAAEKAGIDPYFKEYDDPRAPLLFVISENIHRRHLNPSQKACLALKLKDEIAKAIRPGRQANPPGTSRSAAAKIFQVSESLLAMAQSVRTHSPSVFEEVAAGRLTVSVAYRSQEKYLMPKKPVKRKKLIQAKTASELGIPDVFCAHETLWEFDRKMGEQGWNLQLSRKNGGYVAWYYGGKIAAKQEGSMRLTCASVKAAVISAARERLL